MRRSTDRILTTHVGKPAARPHDLLDMLKARLDGKAIDQRAYDSKVSEAVDRMVVQQVEAGIDIVSDGEMSKPGHAIYIEERLTGYEQRPGHDTGYYAAEKNAFPEFYEEYFKPCASWRRYRACASCGLCRSGGVRGPQGT